jgi:hypothetical protein
MKTILLIFCLSVIASAEVLVNESIKADPATGVKLVTVLLTIKGDKPYSPDHSGAPAELSIMCQQISSGKQHKSVVALTLGTGVVAETGFPVPGSGFFQSLGFIYTLIRFDEETQPRQVAWRQTTDYPGLLIQEDFKFIRDHIFKSKLVHIEVKESGAGTDASSFDLSGIKQEFSKHQECKQ